jgi:hypothetical protein
MTCQHTFLLIPVGEPMGPMPGGLEPAKLNPTTRGLDRGLRVSHQLNLSQREISHVRSA